MRFLFDTDHLSILQRGEEPAQSRIMARFGPYSAAEFACSIVSFGEQTRGANAHVKAARWTADVVRRYRLLAIVLETYATMIVLPFDQVAADTFDRLRSQGARIGTMDLRIASIALSQSLVLLTRNRTDFDKVPGLVAEDWTE